jgi:hypothetical protein
LIVVARIGAAVLIGGIIGLERSFRGRPAGFRTNALVCIASALLMLVTVYQGEWMTAVPTEAIRTDPTRMAQGIMTGIGFLGAVPRSWWTADLVLSGLCSVVRARIETRQGWWSEAWGEGCGEPVHPRRPCRLQHPRPDEKRVTGLQPAANRLEGGHGPQHHHDLLLVALPRYERALDPPHLWASNIPQFCRRA